MVAWAEKRKEYQGALKARAELLSLQAEKTRTSEREFLLDSVRGVVKAPALAVTVARLSQERAKPDLERRPEYMERELPRLKDKLEREQKNFFAPADKRMLLALVRRAQALGEGERIAAIDRHFGSTPAEKDVSAKIDALYAASKLMDLAERQKMSGETEAQLRARKDPLLDFGFDLTAEVVALDELRDRRAGASVRLMPEWRRAVLAHAGKPVAPDANSTLRVTFAKVKGYAPRDGAFYTPQTTLAGVMEKHTGQEPFDVPEKVAAAAKAKRYGPWLDQRLKDVPVNFLADADTTGGNSGSPTVNGKGQLVGVNFDRVWENVSNDFGYNPDVARNVNVDVRYVLWLLDQVEDADGLLRELGVRKGPRPRSVADVGLSPERASAPPGLRTGRAGVRQLQAVGGALGGSSGLGGRVPAAGGAGVVPPLGAPLQQVPSAGRGGQGDGGGGAARAVGAQRGPGGAAEGARPERSGGPGRAGAEHDARGVDGADPGGGGRGR